MTYLVEAIRRLDTGERQVRRVGEYETRREAIRAAEQLVDTFLLRAPSSGMSAAELCHRYETQGEIPVIFNDRQGMQSFIWFNYSEYARSRAALTRTDEIEAVAGGRDSPRPEPDSPCPAETCPAPNSHCISPS